MNLRRFILYSHDKLRAFKRWRSKARIFLLYWHEQIDWIEFGALSILMGILLAFLMVIGGMYLFGQAI